MLLQVGFLLLWCQTCPLLRQLLLGLVPPSISVVSLSLLTEKAHLSIFGPPWTLKIEIIQNPLPFYKRFIIRENLAFTGSLNHRLILLLVAGIWRVVVKVVLRIWVGGIVGIYYSLADDV